MERIPTRYISLQLNAGAQDLYIERIILSDRLLYSVRIQQYDGSLQRTPDPASSILRNPCTHKGLT